MWDPPWTALADTPGCVRPLGRGWDCPALRGQAAQGRGGGLAWVPVPLVAPGARPPRSRPSPLTPAQRHHLSAESSDLFASLEYGGRSDLHREDGGDLGEVPPSEAAVGSGCLARGGWLSTGLSGPVAGLLPCLSAPPAVGGERDGFLYTETLV